MAIRRNFSQNPACKVDASGGHSGGARVTGLSGFPRTTGFQVSTNTTGGSSRGFLSPGQTVTASAYVRTSFTGTLTCGIYWYNGSTYISQATASTSVTSGVVKRVSMSATAPSGTTQMVFGWPSRSGTITVTAVLFELGTTVGSYFDGDTQPGGAWESTDGTSPSTFNDVAAPTVSAGADATAAQLSVFDRTASEIDGGATITSRSWSVVAGPGQVGETLSTTAGLSWKPLTPGGYTLRYTAANSAGSGSDDVAVTVTETTHALSAPLKLAAALQGAKNSTGSLPAVLRLTAAWSGNKRGVGSLPAPLRLTASWVGARNLLTATLRLQADIAATSGTRTAALGSQPLTLRALVDGTGSERAGDLTDLGLRLAAAFTGERIISAVDRVTPRLSLAITHELVVVGVVFQASGPPSYEPLDAITWSGLSWTDELSKAQTLNVGCKIASLPETILQRFRSPVDLPSELWLYRNGKLVFAGEPWSGQVQGESLTLTARGLLGYLDYMLVENDVTFTNTDQTVIATRLVDAWQATPYGNFGIDTSNIPPSGVLRDATYLAKEEHKVGQRVAELGARINGFDVAVDPASRRLMLAYPRAGRDKSSGEDAVVFDRSNITSSNIAWSIAPGDVASDVFGVGTGANSDPIRASVVNEQLRARFGRRAAFASFDGVKEPATLVDHLTAMRDARGDAFKTPGPDTRVTPDSDLDAYDVGDTVSYALHDLLSVQAPYRLLKRQVSVAATGQESVSVAFQ